MALRDKLRERAQPLLEPDEQIEEVFLAQTGPTPWLGLLTTLIWFAVKRRIVVVTDRSIVVMSAGWWTGTNPKGVLARLARGTRLGPLSGLWGKTTLGAETVHVHKRFHGDVARADANAAGAPLPPPAVSPAS